MTPLRSGAAAAAAGVAVVPRAAAAASAASGPFSPKGTMRMPWGSVCACVCLKRKPTGFGGAWSTATGVNVGARASVGGALSAARRSASARAAASAAASDSGVTTMRFVATVTDAGAAAGAEAGDALAVGGAAGDEPAVVGAGAGEAAAVGFLPNDAMTAKSASLRRCERGEAGEERGKGEGKERERRRGRQRARPACAGTRSSNTAARSTETKGARRNEDGAIVRV